MEYWKAGIVYASVTLLGTATTLRGSEAFVYEPDDGNTLPYRLVQPDDQQDGTLYPLVLCLHGAGGRGTDNQGRGTEAFKVLSYPQNRKTYPAFLLAPQCPPNEQWVDTPWARGSYSIDAVPLSYRLGQVKDLLDQILETYPVDPDRVYVTGQSMGGYGTWDLILRFPEIFAAAVPVCGAGDPAQTERIRDLPLWVFHGADDGVVPVTGSRDMVEALRALDSSVRYTEYPGIEHISWGKAWQEPELLPWLFRQKKPHTETQRHEGKRPLAFVTNSSVFL